MNNDQREKVPSPQYLSQNGFQKQYRTAGYDSESKNHPIEQTEQGDEPTKSFDYMFIEISNEQFMAEFNNSKIQIKRPEHVITPVLQKNAFKSPVDQKFGGGMRSPGKILSEEGPNLMGLVSVKAYDKLYTSEVPQVTCHLMPSQLDHLKVLICEEAGEKKRLTNDAQEKLEAEK